MRINTEKMRLERAKQRLSQANVAIKAGTSQNHYSAIESGQKIPGSEILYGISKALNIPLSDLILED